AHQAAVPFPIEGYDELEVVEILPRLGELTPPQLEEVRRREASGRAHPWVLARIDALLESEAETGEWEREALARSAAGGEGRGEEPEWVEPRADWDEPQPEWAPPRPGGAPSGDWAASDFPLESGGYGELGVGRELPIDGYENLRANEVLPLLSGLDAEDLKLVREVESGGKARTSILSRIDALLSRGVGLPGVSAPTRKTPAKKAAKGPSKAALALPIADYDSLTVAQITSQLEGLTVPELKTLRTYEKRHKSRAGVVSRIESALTRFQ
ncbi:MAG: hypothetical protein ACRDY7_18240, partial [Acidimicrobiia bacterium]